MLRKTIIALVAAASVGMLAPTVALARGGGGGGGFHSGTMASGGFHGGGFHHGGDFQHGFHHERGFGGYGYYPYDDGYYDYGYPDYAYGDSYYDNGDCYTVQRRVHSRSGWHVHPVQVCS